MESKAEEKSYDTSFKQQIREWLLSKPVGQASSLTFIVLI